MSKQDEMLALMADLNISDHEWDALSDQVKDTLMAREKMATQTARQNGINRQFLTDHIFAIHQALCPGEIATWQKQAEQALEAALKLRWRDPAFELPDDEIRVLVYFERPGEEPGDGTIIEASRVAGVWCLGGQEQDIVSNVLGWMHPPYPTPKLKEAA